MAYPDYWKEKRGDGLEVHHDYGFISYYRYGVEQVVCSECGKFFPEHEDQNDGLCPECYEQSQEQDVD